MKKTGKRGLAAFLVLTMLVCIFAAVPASAGEGKSGDYEYVEKGGKVTITKYVGPGGDVVIPSEIDGYPVIAIGYPNYTVGAFEHSSVTSVTIPEGVTSIGVSSFFECTSLKSVVIPDSVTEIKSGAFSRCTALTNIVLPEKVIKIELFAFYQTGYYNDKDNWSDKVLYIGRHLIHARESITGSYTVRENTITIADEAFFNCEKLEGVSIPDGVVRIGENAFYDCSSLESISLPDSLTDLGGNFLETKYYRDDNNWTDGVLYIDNCLVYVGQYSPSGYSVREGTVCIGEDAFGRCKSLTSVTIPDSVRGMGEKSFLNCGALERIEVSEGNGVYSSDDGVLYDKDKTTLLFCPLMKRQVTIPDSVTTIVDRAFEWCIHLRTVNMPDSVRYIGNYAFDNCEVLPSISIPGSVEFIGVSAFNQLTRDIYFGGTEEEWLNCAWDSCYPGWTTVYCSDKVIPAKASTVFRDVIADRWYVEAVSYVYYNKLMKGTATRYFSPNAAMTRAMVVTVLFRAEGNLSPLGELPYVDLTAPFTDIKADWYRWAVNWAYAFGIVNGVGGTLFDPDGNVTREQLATIMYRYSEYRGADVSGRASLDGFPDGAKTHNYAKDAMSWAVYEGLISGTKAGDKVLLDPRGNATRAQVATILMRFLEN